MDLYEQDSYKQVLRERIKAVGKTRKTVTLRWVSEKIPIQYTYLSKVMNDEKTHLNEDHLFRACKLLEFFPEEIDYLILLRSLATSNDEVRRSYLQGKVNHLREARKLNASIQEFNSLMFTREMSYLFDPLCVLAHVALHIDDFLKNPKKLCPVFGISFTKLKEVLHKLNQLEFIELAADGVTVVRPLKGHIHYSTNHPLMRMHQSVMRTYAHAQLIKTSEEDKHNFMVTFSADSEAFLRVKELFHGFLKEVEKVVIESPSRQIYQMSFDLFKWD
jgi:hypothetical protein